MRPIRPRGDEGGFALVLTLVVILALSVMTEVMTRWVSNALDHAFANREQVDARRGIAEAAAVSMYLLGTRPLSFRGIETSAIARLPAATALGTIGGFEPAEDYIRLDDQPYLLSGTVLRFQDARGLINLNFGSADDLFAVLGLLVYGREPRAGYRSCGLHRFDSLTLNGRSPICGRRSRPPTRHAIALGDRRTWLELVEGLPGGQRMGTVSLTTTFVGFNINSAARSAS
jgi:hypothetical protein